MRYIRQVAVFLVLLIVCGLLLYSAYADIEAKTIAQVNNEQLVHAGQAAAGFESFFTTYNNSLSFLAGNDHIITLDPDGRELMRDFFKSHDDEISSITRVDEHGIITYTYPVEASTGADISSQSHVRQLMSTHAVVISDVFTSVQGFRAIAFHMPVFENGTFKGSIAILIPFDSLAKENLGSIRILDSGYAWTISHEGIVLYSPYPGQVGKSVFNVFNNSPSVIAMAQDAMKGSRGVTSYTVSGDPARQEPPQKFQAIYLPVNIGSTSWSIIVATPENEILGTIQGFRNNLIIVSAVLILSLLFFTYYVARARGIVQEEEIRRKADDELRKSEERYRNVVEDQTEFISRFLPDGTHIFVNEAYCRYLGLKREEILGHRFRPKIPAADQESVRRFFASLTQDHPVGTIEQRIIMTDGTVRWQRWTDHAIFDPSGKITEYQSVGLDITDRKREEQALVENEQRLTSIYNTVGDSIFQLTVEPQEQYRFTSINAAFSRTTGIPPDQVIGRTVKEIIPEPALSLVLEKYRQAIAQKGIVRWEETSAYPTGQLTGEVSIAPIFDQAGHCKHLIGSVHDITERKQAEEKLLEAHHMLEKRVAERTRELSEANIRLQELDRLKSAFLATMSHELRTPLNSIIGFSGILHQELAGPLNEEQKKQLGMVSDSAEHLLALINDVLDLSKIEAGQLRIANEIFDIRPVIDKAARTVKPLAEAKHLALETEVAPDIGAVRADSRRVEQVLLNLLSNAIKFTEKGYIRIMCSSGDDTILISVTDTGIGIKPGDMDKLFRPFTQVDTGLTRQHEGTGLGLSISERLVTMMGGTIRVESEPGRGSTFTFTLPAERRSP
jgi:PAS domain S-box-containing protein